ncbi:DUF6362 family protein [Caldimonas brevitalea]|uniref:RNA polymerase subunit sigma n=1 Tax=Caldimonas brevitalea TaxID=413882 RepID=A0A0G3BML8_9BURK|nr:DUF6362 family protein [Caldimonas brevitalea]AKJ30662.1 RNA polymerase subunit sigma [Caldimonas brevitalea]
MAEQWTVEAVAMRFADAADTARRLPPVRVQGYLSAWPQVARESWEALGRDDDRPLTFPPSPQAVERMLQAMRWVQWLEVEQRHLVWMRAKRYGWSEIGKRFGCDRNTAWRRWLVALGAVADRLNQQQLP